MTRITLSFSKKLIGASGCMKKVGRSITYRMPGLFTLQDTPKKKKPWESQIEYYKSLYMFFRKNRGVVPYIALRILKPFKILINLILNILGNLITLFQIERLRNRLLKYHKLLIWHILLCPESMGIRREP